MYAKISVMRTDQIMVSAHFYIIMAVLFEFSDLITITRKCLLNLIDKAGIFV